jgi:hypothetical protein
MSLAETADPGADALQAMLEASASTGRSELSAEESQRFQKAFLDPEFRKLFAGYMDELQDPKNREETESYISQLEGEKKVPAGKELIRPQSGFVVKTYKRSEDKGQLEGSKDKGDSLKGSKDKEGKNPVDKVFINIVKSDKIAPPVKTVSAKGTHYSVPYSVGPPHMEIDNSGEVNVPCFDVCFHPEALDLCTNKPLTDLIVQTAMEGIESSYKRNASADKNTKLNREYHILKGVKYKSGSIIPTMMIDQTQKLNEWSNDNVSSTKTSPISADPIKNDAKKTTVAPSSADASSSVKVSPIPLVKPAITPTVVTGPAIKKGFLNKVTDSKIKKNDQSVIDVKAKSKSPSDTIAIPSFNNSNSNSVPEDQPLPSIIKQGKSGLVQDITDAPIQAVAPANSSTVSNSGTTATGNSFDGLKAASTTLKKKVPDSFEKVLETAADSQSKTPKYTMSERGQQSQVYFINR